MPKRLRKIRRIFISLQFLILLLAVGISLFFVSSNHIKKSFIAWEINLDQTAQLITSQLRMNSEFPPAEVEGYLIFVIDQKDGSYIFKRKISFDSNGLWDSHRSKLIYQMQKQKQGWVTYPREKKKAVNQRMIRYLAIEDLGWIVAVEAVMPENKGGMFSIFDRDSGIRIVIALFISLFFFRLITNYNFSIMKKIIADSLESSFMNLSNEEIWGGNSSEHKIEEKVEHSPSLGGEPSSDHFEPVGNNFGGKEFPMSVEPSLMKEHSTFIQKEEPHISKAESVLEEKSSDHIMPEELPSKHSSKSDKLLAENIEKEKKFNSKPLFEEKELSSLDPKLPKIVKPIKEEVFFDEDSEEDSDLDEMKIDVKKIKSPVLRKMIQELRNRD